MNIGEDQLYEDKLKSEPSCLEPPIQNMPIFGPANIHGMEVPDTVLMY